MDWKRPGLHGALCPVQVMHAVGDSLWADCAVMGRGQHKSQVSPRATDNGMMGMTSVAPAWSPLQQNPPVSAASALPGIEIPRHIWLYSYLTLFVFTIVQRPVAGLPERCQEPWPEVFSGVGCCVGGRVLLHSCHLHVAGGDGVGVEVGGGLVDGRLLGSVSRLLSPWTPSHGPSRWTGSMAAGVGCGSFRLHSAFFTLHSAVCCTLAQDTDPRNVGLHKRHTYHIMAAACSTQRQYAYTAWSNLREWQGPRPYG